MKDSKSVRIAIVGAGPAGLTAALEFRKKGYEQVTVFEKAPLAGGKCKTFFLEGRSYEMGAVVSTPEYRIVDGISKELGTKRFIVDTIRYKDSENHPTTQWNKKDYPKIIKQLAFNYLPASIKNHKIFGAGLKGINKDLHLPYDQYLKKIGAPLLDKVFKPVFTTFGYGYFEEVPAAYVTKYYRNWAMIAAMGKNFKFKGFADGVGPMWQELAAKFDVKYNENIVQIERGRNVKIRSNTGEYEFDKVLLTCPLEETLKFMDASKEEKELFSKIKHYDYYTYLCRIDNFKNESFYVSDHFEKDKMGHPMLFYKRWPDKDIFTLYIIGQKHQTQKEIEENIRQDVEKLGGAVREIYTFDKWKYFPHVDQKELDGGFYEKLDSLQGQKNTYYAGELLNFSTMELSARNAQYMSNRLIKDYQKEFAQNRRLKSIPLQEDGVQMPENSHNLLVSKAVRSLSFHKVIETEPNHKDNSITAKSMERKDPTGLPERKKDYVPHV